MRVLCTCPNASVRINGVRFFPVEGGMVSEDIPEAVAAGFMAIPGYRAIVEPPDDVAVAMAVAEETHSTPEAPRVRRRRPPKGSTGEE